MPSYSETLCRCMYISKVHLENPVLSLYVITFIITFPHSVMEEAGKCVLEPIMNVEINSPAEFQGEILSAIGKRKGVINDQDSMNDEVTFVCDVALNDMFGFASELRSLTEVCTFFIVCDSFCIVFSMIVI